MSCPDTDVVVHVVHDQRERRELRAEFSYDERRNDIIVVAGEFREIRGLGPIEEVYYHDSSDMYDDRHLCDRSEFRAWCEELNAR